MNTVSNKRIYLSPPDMGEKEFLYFKEAFDSNWIAPCGPHLTKFEQKICEFTDCGYACALSSGTAAMHLALELCGIQKGDIILCPSLTFIASVSWVVKLGAIPLFFDSEPQSWNIDYNLVEEYVKKLYKKGRLPKAIIVVHLYGQSANMDPLLRLCDAYGIILIEDAAESLGALYKGKATGIFGKCGVYSFNGNKIITTSSGGMLVSKDKALIDRARFLSTQARESFVFYEHKVLGYNYRLSNLLAAIGCAQLENLLLKIQKRKQIRELYFKHLSIIEGIEFLPVAPWGEPNYWLTCILVDPIKVGVDRDFIIKKLEEKNIESRPVWKPMHMQPCFKDAQFIGSGFCERLFKMGLCLPSGSSLSEDEQLFVIENILNIIRS